MPFLIVEGEGVVEVDVRETTSLPGPTQPSLPTISSGAPTAGIASTPTAGKALALSDSGTVDAPSTLLRVLTSDPVAPMQGEVWFRGDQNQLRWREGGVTYQVTGTAI